MGFLLGVCKNYKMEQIVNTSAKFTGWELKNPKDALLDKTKTLKNFVLSTSSSNIK